MSPRYKLIPKSFSKIESCKSWYSSFSCVVLTFFDRSIMFIYFFFQFSWIVFLCFQKYHTHIKTKILVNQKHHRYKALSSAPQIRNKSCVFGYLWKTLLWAPQQKHYLERPNRNLSKGFFPHDVTAKTGVLNWTPWVLILTPFWNQYEITPSGVKLRP